MKPNNYCYSNRKEIEEDVKKEKEKFDNRNNIMLLSEEIKEGDIKAKQEGYTDFAIYYLSQVKIMENKIELLEQREKKLIEMLNDIINEPIDIFKYKEIKQKLKEIIKEV